MNRRAIAALLAAALAGSSCVSAPWRAVDARPAPANPPSADPYYGYTPQPITPVIEAIRAKPRFRQWRVTWPSARPLLRPDETIIVEWFETTAPGRRPAVLVYPILGGDYPVERGFARYFAEHGLHAALIYREKFKFSRERDAGYMELLFQQAVVKNRQVVDWLSAQPTVDAAHLGGFGISMGGIQAVITAACEPRLSAHVMCLAAGPMADILRMTHDRIVTKPRDRYLRETGHDLAWLTTAVQRALRSDPLRLAPAVNSSHVLYIAARFDRTMPWRLSRQLWQALGQPRRLTLPLGHYTSLLALHYVRWRALRWFEVQWSLR